LKQPIHHLIPATLLLTLSGVALGQSSAELSIRGEIVPPACRIALSQAVVDLGTHSYSKLHATFVTVLPTQEVQMNIECDGPVTVAFRAANNRASSIIPDMQLPPGVAASRTFGASNGYSAGFTDRSAAALGFAVADDPASKIGMVETALDLDRMIVDGENLNATGKALAFSTSTTRLPTSRSATFSTAMVALTGPSWYVMQRQSGQRESTFAPYKNLSVPVVLMPALAPKTGLPANQEIALDGSVTFELRYF